MSVAEASVQARLQPHPSVARRRAVPWFGLLCTLAVATQAALLLRFILTERPNLPAYESRMTIDAATYVLLIVNASTRFLVPATPMLVLLQMQCLLFVASLLVPSLGSGREPPRTP